MADVSLPWVLPGLLVPSALTIAWVLALTRYKIFFNDEWAFIASRRPWQLELFLLSHNGHWSTIPILIWKLLFVSVGLRSYVPYETALLVAHVVATFMLFLLIRQASGDVAAVASALILLLLGSGSENIVWAFQIGWVGSVAFGLLGMLLASRPTHATIRGVGISLAILLSLMCSSVGLAFLFALVVELGADRRRRRFLLALLLPACAFLAWFFVFDTGSVPGAPGISQSLPRGELGLAFGLKLAMFVLAGIEGTAQSVLDFGVPGLAALAAVVGILAWSMIRTRKVESWQIGMIAGVFAWFGLTSIGRVQYGVSYAAQPRYLYVGTVFLLPLIAYAISLLPWRGIFLPSCAVLFAFALFNNVIQLRDAALSQQSFMQIEEAELQTVEVFRGAPDMDLSHTIDDRVMPQFLAGDYLNATAELGSPVAPASVEGLHKLPSWAVDRVMVNLFGKSLTVSAVDTESVAAGTACRIVDSTSGATIDLRSPDASSLVLQSDRAASAQVSLGFLDVPSSSDPVLESRLLPGVRESVHLPDTGKAIFWNVRLKISPSGNVRVCTDSSLRVLGGDGFYEVDAFGGNLDQGWSTVPDLGAIGHEAAEAKRAPADTYHNAILGDPFEPDVQALDVWFRVRISDPTIARPEMTLGLWDDEAEKWVTSTEYRPSDIGSSYSWIEVAAGAKPTAGHHVQLIASFTHGLNSDWFVDEAVFAPSGYAPPGPYAYSAEASRGKLDPGWTTAADAGAVSGLAAKAAAGSSRSYRNDVFGGNSIDGGPVLPKSRRMDLWYRIRVAGTAGTSKEMTFGLWDDEGRAWLASTKYSPHQLSTGYVWVKVAQDVIPVSGHHVQFVASFTGRLTTDWYVDEAMLLSSGAVPPSM